MLILGLDSTAKAASCAVFDTVEKTIIAYGGVNAKVTHSETLLPLVESVLKAAKLTLNDIDTFAVANGPGSFTGVRISVSAIKGMAFALDKRVCGVSTLLSLGYNLAGFECIACCVMDARRGQFYNALFRISDKKITRLTPDRAASTAELASELMQFESDKILIVGDGAELFFDSLQVEKNVLDLHLAPLPQIHQNAVSVCLAASSEIAENAVTAKELMPLYLRLPQAERERKKP
ncbi:MAG: tRNA (adenosine(37)-N6)-threonylcarbamoyltransferase complex dimerization subunit type 1 TsaB [Oscillospiraceae bacterium]|nr:tRNA (adenosine(37)-N6)-threonylcarbamoyltransferase complex dimerization subunit type 1 TsaB [Oscillospiraceae bacterium]